MNNKPHIYLCDYKWRKFWRVSMPIPWKQRTKIEKKWFEQALAFARKMNHELGHTDIY